MLFLPVPCFHRRLSSHLQDDLLRILGEKHRLYDFLGTLSLKCSYLLFNKEHVKEFLLEASIQKSSGNTQYIQSCMNILVVKDAFPGSSPGEILKRLILLWLLCIGFCVLVL